MDIPLVLEQLRPGEDWGPCATSVNAYADFAAAWRGVSPCPTLDEMQAAWSAIEAERPAKELQAKRGKAKGLLAADDPDRVMLRAILQVVMESLAEVRAKVGLPVRTWPQLMAAVQSKIDAGKADA